MALGSAECGERQISHKAELRGFPPKSPHQHFPRLVFSTNSLSCPKLLGIAASSSLSFMVFMQQGAQHLFPLDTGFPWMVERVFLPKIPTF